MIQSQDFPCKGGNGKHSSIKWFCPDARNRKSFKKAFVDELALGVDISEKIKLHEL